ncbi:MAG: PAS domain-containing protein [Pseudomonadales bacterium]|nr:PAS domain-containing protein [Pseudomonadales bacterium]
MEMHNLHWIMNILQHMNNGLVVVDRDYKICMWNSFMENHSGFSVDDVDERVLFDVFPDLQRSWFQKKIDTVFHLGCQAYTIWEERPYIFKFDNYRPITGNLDFMYQYSTLIPLTGVDTSTSHVAILISDVTDAAVNRLALMNANPKLS